MFLPPFPFEFHFLYLSHHAFLFPFLSASTEVDRQEGRKHGLIAALSSRELVPGTSFDDTPNIDQEEVRKFNYSIRTVTMCILIMSIFLGCC